MSTIAMQRDLVMTLKNETLLNLEILNKVHPLSKDLSRLIFKENALEKLTQNVFNPLTHYLVGLIDPQVFAALPWPLYDTNTERAYRSDMSSFVSSYSSKGLLAPVMSSYLVNPGCYKVTFLIFQMSQMAVQRVILSKMNRDQEVLYKDVTEKYKSQPTADFIDHVNEKTVKIQSKFSYHISKRKETEKAAEMLREQIKDMEETLQTGEAQEYIDNLIDTFIKQYTLDEESNLIFEEIKNINVPSPFFDFWLEHVDKQMSDMETEWDTRMSPFLDICKQTQGSTELLIARHMGEADRSSFTIEYNPKTDEICTDELQNQVNSQQKYILKNITKDGRLNFPNLIRGFLISICYIMKNTEIGEEIYHFNGYLEGGRKSYKEILSAMKALNERVAIAESKLQPTPVCYNESVSIRELSEIPPMPDLSDLKMNREYFAHPHDSYTPLNFTKHQFNLRRKRYSSLTKPLPKSLLITPFHYVPRDDFLKGMVSSREVYDPNATQSLHLSAISTGRANETIAGPSGFTKEQIARLLSTKKKSSNKKQKYKTDRPPINIKKGGLFHDSSINESVIMIRSHSSPNLYENRDKHINARSRKLSIMKEDSPSLSEMSGIAALERDSSHSTPQGVASLDSSRKLIDSSSMPIIVVSHDSQESILGERIDLNGEVRDVSLELETTPYDEESKVSKITHYAEEKTPKNNIPMQKASSLERIINRFKKVRANVIPMTRKEDSDNFKTIAEENNVNFNNEESTTVNRILLPDLLSPSCSVVGRKSDENLNLLCSDSDEERPRKSRQSLGTILGVDHTFLDQFDLVD